MVFVYDGFFDRMLSTDDLVFQFQSYFTSGDYFYVYLIYIQTWWWRLWLLYIQFVFYIHDYPISKYNFAT